MTIEKFSLEFFIPELIRTVCKIFNDYSAIAINEIKYCKVCKMFCEGECKEFYSLHKERCRISDVDDIFEIAFFDCLSK